MSTQVGIFTKAPPKQFHAILQENRGLEVLANDLPVHNMDSSRCEFHGTLKVSY